MDNVFPVLKATWDVNQQNNQTNLSWCYVSVAANGFQKFAISLLGMKCLPNNTTAPL